MLNNELFIIVMVFIFYVKRSKIILYEFYKSSMSVILLEIVIIQFKEFEIFL